MKALLRDRYVLLMFALSVVSWLAFFFIDNIFYNRVGAQFASEEQVSAFMGIYLAVLGIITLLNNSFLTGFIINKLGVLAGLTVLPLSLLIVTAAFSLVGTLWGIVPVLFWIATVLKIVDLSLNFSVDDASQTILYQVLPPSDRSRIQTVDGGMVRMVAVGSAGILLLLMNQVLQLSVIQLSYFLLLIIAGWLVVVRLTGRQYPLELLRALGRRRLTGASLVLNDAVTRDLISQALRNPKPGAALYAMGLLAESDPEALAVVLPEMLDHPAPEVRCEALRRIEIAPLIAERERVQLSLRNDPDPAVRAAALRTLAAVGGPDAGSVLVPYLSAHDRPARREALVGLLIYGSESHRAAALDELSRLADSAISDERLLAVEVIEASRADEGCARLSPLLDDPNPAVRRRALLAVPALRCDHLWPAVASGLARLPARRAAQRALAEGGAAALPAIRDSMGAAGTQPDVLIGLAEACGRICGAEATEVLLIQLMHSNNRVRGAVLAALAGCGYRPTGEAAEQLRSQLIAEVSHAAWLTAALRDCLAAPELDYLRRITGQEYSAARDRVFHLLTMLHEPGVVRQAHERLTGPSESLRAYAVEILDVSLPGDVRALVMPLVEELPPAARLRQLGRDFDAPALTPTERVEALAHGDGWYSRWLTIASAHAAGEIGCSTETMLNLLDLYRRSDDPILQETAALTVARLGEPAANGGPTMLSTIERVIILKDVDLFASTPDELLAEVAELLEEVTLAPDETVFAKGDSGDSLYIVVSGEVRVHDGDFTINILGESQVFGEMALLDPEPRMASVTAVTDTLLLRLDQEPFYELIDTRSEVARGIIRVLSDRLRRRVQEVATLTDAAAQRL